MSLPDEMTCRELVELVSDYLEGALPAYDRARFEEHLGDCRYCVSYLDQMRQTIRTMGRLSEESISEEARDALLEAFRNWKAAS